MQNHGIQDCRHSTHEKDLKVATSRADLSSVKTLSAAQLERKRASDRDAQRRIRRKTKDRIFDLENSILQLRRVIEDDGVEVSTLQRRNKTLEEINAHLRLRLEEASVNMAPVRPGKNSATLAHVLINTTNHTPDDLQNRGPKELLTFSRSSAASVSGVVERVLKYLIEGKDSLAWASL